MNDWLLAVLPLLAGWLLDLALGDPQWLPHPIVWFGKAIVFCERRLNKGSHRRAKGAVTAVALIAAVFFGIWLLRRFIPIEARLLLDTLIVFYCLA